MVRRWSVKAIARHSPVQHYTYNPREQNPVSCHYPSPMSRRSPSIRDESALPYKDRSKSRTRNRVTYNQSDAEDGEFSRFQLTRSSRSSVTGSPTLSLASLSGFDVSECETVLTQYMKRIQHLEKEVGQVLSKAPDSSM